MYPPLKLIVFFILVAIGCADDGSYKLLGLSTNYEDARNHLNRMSQLPSSFGSNSLELEHQNLLENSCEPKVFYFIGRHAARFPSDDDVVLHNSLLLELIERMKQEELVKSSPEKYSQFLNWTPNMSSKHNKLITDLGSQQERFIAQRFKQIYPEFFDAKKSEIKIGLTRKIRTAQTCAEFLKEVDNYDYFNIKSCKEEKLPTNNIQSPSYNVDEIWQNKCYEELIENYEVKALDFHQHCRKISGRGKIKEPLIQLARSKEVLEIMNERVSKSLGFTTNAANGEDSHSGTKLEPPINSKVIWAIYETCRFERNQGIESIWCSVFEQNDLEALVYREDVHDYIKDAYGSQSNIKQTCQVISNIVEILKLGQKLANNEKKLSYFYFTHGTPLKKIMAALNLFKDEINFSEDKIREFAENLTNNLNREWQSSLICPNSANMAFILYKCPSKHEKIPIYRLLTTVTEQPVRVSGCLGSVRCPLELFLSTYSNISDNCNLKEICAPKEPDNWLAKKSRELLSSLSTKAREQMKKIESFRRQ